ncbi:MBL fold metallo-hydrolase [Pseudalgibacter alginicilyticus]|uniref:MBL fold metallo-hydrolase n=1 Tax=Pseudalgibacter alginicilyticus TaxID=1736674 RepID=A0A0P0D3T7_9FLAO|nr:MBL fold metallo-hydrolase [Pseudalgibacter alginicilyticus]ALJ05633.1 MBL fold metallo-hydrolase [Pseudalgibacter alginicilyticus]
MNLYPINAGNFKLDGGAMFGVVPKSLWQKTNPADTNNMIDIAARCLLIENGNKLILIDTGMGNKQSDKFFGYYHLWGSDSIDSSLKKYGFHPNDITDVFLTHLHFDHSGGAIQWNKNRTGYEPVFKNAHFWSNKDHWLWATKPNKREKASFLTENLLPMEASGQLKFTSLSNSNILKNSKLGFDIFFADGHTDKQMIPLIQYKGKTIAFMADLLPTVGHLPLPYIMGYDTRPLLSLNEKETFLNLAAKNNYYLFLEHDASHEIITVKQTERGVRLDNIYKAEDIFN